MRLLATQRLIDSVWSMVYEVVDGGVFIHRYDRENDAGYMLEGKVPKLRVMEDTERNIIAIDLDGKTTYNVVNKKGIFSYSETLIDQDSGLNFRNF